MIQTDLSNSLQRNSNRRSTRSVDHETIAHLKGQENNSGLVGRSCEADASNKAAVTTFPDDLDEYAGNNETHFVRRASIRMSRKSSLNRVIPGLVNGALYSNNGSSNEKQGLHNVFTFMNQEFDEQSRELSIKHNPVLNEPDTTLMKRPSSVGCAELKRNLQDFKHLENITEAAPLADLDKVIMRRSSSNSETDLSNKVSYKNRREINSVMVLAEEAEDSNLSRSQSKSSSRLSGLKKLGSLYKTFQDEIDYNPTRRSSIAKPEQMPTENADGLNEEEQALVCSLPPPIPTSFHQSLNRNSKLRHTIMYHQASFHDKFAHDAALPSNIVSNRIMKFESQHSSPTELSNDSVSQMEAVSGPQQKVKSLSKNWEQMTSKCGTTSACQLARANCSFSVVEQIEKFNSNNLIQLKQQQQELSCNNKARVNSGCTTCSDDNEASKDDGFETQSNASSSQTSDSLTAGGSSNNNNNKATCFLSFNNNCFNREFENVDLENVDLNLLSPAMTISNNFHNCRGHDHSNTSHSDDYDHLNELTSEAEKWLDNKLDQQSSISDSTNTIKQQEVNDNSKLFIEFLKLKLQKSFLFKLSNY